MKKLLTLALVGAMLTATGITAFAADPETKATNVSYDVQPAYTVTIPATVDLGDNDVIANIEASDVLLEAGKQIKVDLTAASNTASGSTFNAKNGDSAVTYTITGDKAIAVGDTVATFAANGSKTLTFSAADKSAATVAGSHTETLTFTIAVEDAVATPTLADAFENGATIKLKVNDQYGVAEINFVNENGSITFEDKSDNNWFTNDARGSISGDDLTIQLSVGFDYGDRFINTFVFNKANNTYSYSCGGYGNTTLSGLVINDADITDQLTAQ